MKNILLGLSVLFTFNGFSQVIEIDPPFPTQNDTITVTYHADLGIGGLNGIVPVYTHTGVITSTSSGPSGWQYVQGNWGTADPNVAMSYAGPNTHEITYHIPTYYGFPSGTVVEQLAFVFRNADGSLEGKGYDGGDIFYPVYPVGGGLEARIISPELNFVLEPGDSLEIKAASNENATLTLYDNGLQIAQALNTQEIAYTQTFTLPGGHVIELVADNGTTIKRDTVGIIVVPPVQIVPAPSGISDGVNYINDSTVILQLHAPFKDNIFVIGDFNNWFPVAGDFLAKDPGGQKWWVELTGLTPGDEYRFNYVIDRDMIIADPYSEIILNPWDDPYIPDHVYPNMPEYPTGIVLGNVSVMFPGKPEYVWQNTQFTPPNKTELNIYELLIRDFSDSHSYQSLIDSIDYIQKLGINAIELMPNSEFEGNISWGYAPSFHMALDKYYGTIDAYKAFIDTCHGRGIAVIMDFVFNHAFGQSPLVQMYWDEQNNKPASNNPWFNADCPHPPYCWGYDFNHTRQATKDFIDRVNTYWFEEFNIDGVRYDFTKGFSQVGDVGFDATRIQNLKRMADTVWAVNPEAYIILEHWADDNEERQLSDYGMMLWGQATHEYQEATMGYASSSNFNKAVYSFRGFNDPHLVTFPESHDEERLMYKALTFGNSSGPQDVKDLNVALSRTAMTHVFSLAHPGPKMIWMFGELGYDISIDDPCRTCPKEIRWDYYNVPERKSVYNIVSALFKLRNENPVMHTTDFDYNFSGAMKKLHLNSPTTNVALIGNFGVVPSTTNPQFQHTGTWYEYFTGDSIVVTDVNTNITLVGGEFKMYIDQFVESPTIGIEEEVESAELELIVFPNPAADVLYVNLFAQEATLTISNLQGQAVHQEAVNSTDLTKSIDVSGLPAGLYIMVVQSEGTYRTARFAIQR